MLKFIYTLSLMLFSTISHAALFIYDASDKEHKFGSLLSEPGWNYAVKTYVNTVQTIWRPGDVLGIVEPGGLRFRIYTASGLFAPIPSGEAYAIGGTDGVIYLRTIPNSNDPIVVDNGGGGVFGPDDSNDDNTNDDDLFYRDPLIIDLSQDGFHMQSDRLINFDFDGTGQPITTQWVAPNGNEAFVFIDLNRNGQVDNGTELFGDTMFLLETLQPATDGFAALGQYNNPLLGGNNDDTINDADLIWPHLHIWLDIDANGISTPDEIMTMQDANISAISLQTKQSNRQDASGNRIPLWSWATNSNETGNRKHKVIDVFFKTIENNPAFIDTTTGSTE